ncbi:MAG: hypothetical protein ABI462_14170 [Ignavibacteria bacterium]
MKNKTCQCKQETTHLCESNTKGKKKQTQIFSEAVGACPAEGEVPKVQPTFFSLLELTCKLSQEFITTV